MLGSEESIETRIVFPILAWFFRPKADISVAMMERRAAESTDPGETRSCECGW